MSRQRATFGKLQRERDKQAKAKAKRERRLAGPPEAGDGEEEAPREQSTVSAADVMEMVADLHQRFENSEIGLDDYEEQKAALLSRLPID